MNDLRHWMRLVESDSDPFSAAAGNKVVDATGEPLVVYHGTNRQFDKFDPAAPSVNRKSPTGYEDIQGLFFTGDPHQAYSYGAMTKRKTGAGTTRVIPANIRITNPLNTTKLIKKFQKAGLSFGDAKQKALTQLDRNTHDGVIFQGNGQNPAEYIVFDPEQIRPLLDKRGT